MFWRCCGVKYMYMQHSAKRKLSWIFVYIFGPASFGSVRQIFLLAWPNVRQEFSTFGKTGLCRVKNMHAMYLKYHKARLAPTTPVTSTAISPVKMSIGHKSPTHGFAQWNDFSSRKIRFLLSSYHLHPHTNRCCNHSIRKLQLQNNPVTLIVY